MGCDIHLYPEYEMFTDDEEVVHWSPLSDRIHGSRHYQLFGLLAGVRCGGQMVPLRGLPGDVAYAAKGDNEMFVCPSDGDGYVRPEIAAQWVASGYSKYTHESKDWVTHPDWHSHSWCTTSEFREVLEAVSEPNIKYWGLLAMLEEVERRGKTARLVFWFDN